MSWYPDFVAFEIHDRIQMMFQGHGIESSTLRSAMSWMCREFNYHRYNIVYQVLDEEAMIAYHAVDKGELDEVTLQIVPEKADLAMRLGISLEKCKVGLVFIGVATTQQERQNGQEDPTSGEECQESGQGAEIPGEDGQEARQEVAESRDQT